MRSSLLTSLALHAAVAGMALWHLRPTRPPEREAGSFEVVQVGPLEPVEQEIAEAAEPAEPAQRHDLLPVEDAREEETPDLEDVEIPPPDLHARNPRLHGIEVGWSSTLLERVREPKRASAAPAPEATTPPSTATLTAAPQGKTSAPRLRRNRSLPVTYPARARRRGLEGRVVLLVHISTGGAVEAITVHESSGHAVLDRAALAGVKNWVFSPARRYGRAVPAVVKIPVQFRLSE